MLSAEAPLPQGSNPPTRHRRGPRRRGGNRPTVANPPAAHSTAQASDPALAFRPAALPPATTSTPATAEPANANRSRNPRRGGFGRGGRRGGANAQPMVNGQRVFGGQLTSSIPPSAEGSLAGDAPEFVPGQPIAQRARPPQAPRARRMSKSQAPDIATRTHEDIANRQYECVICTNEVLPNSKIWNCKTCWSVIHLSCVKKWSKNEVSTHQQRAVENEELPPPRQWRCPGCNLPKEELPNLYTCWCEKEIEPRSLPGLPPHSCGQTCSKKRAGHCPHPCDLICHAGPCPPCRYMGPSMPCSCGKETRAKPCLDTNYDSGWSCEQVCGDILPCGQHTCQRDCHEGLCGSCEVLIESRCYCGRVQKSLPCSERDDECQSELQQDVWIGSFNCGTVCQRPFDCGKSGHVCAKRCHVQDLIPAHCPFSADIVSHCPCGKTPLSVLLPEPRKDCSAPIPKCKKKCEKKLVCDHLCQETCHEGECQPCLEAIQITCRCGRTTTDSTCYERQAEPPSCNRICRSQLNCGRHECGERCCPGEKKASERQASKRKHRPLNAPPVIDDIEPEHFCTRDCGKPLKCGNHSCTDLCHKGPCRSCLEAIFHEISCACGRTRLDPPQPCGTRPPKCLYKCTRRQDCGHPPVDHTCHEDSEPCPSCPFLVEKQCICGKRTLKNQRCSFTEVRCGLQCGKKLKCGIHFCQKQCHRPGQCEDATTPCMQPCGRKKTVCDHDCSDPCHAPYPCKELNPCEAKTFITCECQRQKQQVKCLASKTSDGNSKKALDCNDECLKLQRNARLAAALDIDPATHVDDHIPYSSQTLEMFRENAKFCQQYEREFRVFAADEKEKRLRFKPMKPEQRAFLHALAEDFGIDSESQDAEPNRHVCIFKTPRFVSAPMKTLAQCVKIKQVESAPIASLSKGLVRTAEPYNAFLLKNPKFGLTIDELSAALQHEFISAGVEFEISFLPSGDVVLKALPSGSWLQKVETTLVTLKPIVDRRVTSSIDPLASAVVLCIVDTSLNVVKREDDSTGGGWSQVAKGASSSKAPVTENMGYKSSFTVLGKSALIKKKKQVAEEAPEDWEKEVEGWDAG
jgi:transcriptional repressor NF-X1